MGDFPISINLHLTDRCNYHCKFCFARNRCLGRELTFHEWKKIIYSLYEKECLKINFAGGEPTMIPFLPDLISYAKDLGFFTSIISNGSLISKNLIRSIKETIDLIGLSLDSPVEVKERQLGRCFRKANNSSYSHVEQIKDVSRMVNSENIPLKINTTLTSLTWMDNFTPIMKLIHPSRWKILEVHRIKGINDSFFYEFPSLKKAQIKYFLEKHKHFHPIYENSEILTDSYCIITPDGRFYFDQANTYSPEILRYGIDECFNYSYYSNINFSQRNGLYFLSDSLSKTTRETEVKKTG
jgi:radical S-adenosyl methionine domain-containing protein 2